MKRKQSNIKPTRVEILVANDEKRMNDEALAALAGHPGLYRRGEVLVHVVHSEGPKGAVVRPAGSPRIVSIHEATLREMLAERVDFQKERIDRGKPTLVSANPPQQCYRALLHRGAWPNLRPLEGLTECPVLRRDGSILQQPGYDAKTGLLYRPNAAFQDIPSRPTPAQVRTALHDLEHVVCDFPFRGETARSAWLASLLTPLARHAFEGPSPCNVIDSNIRGSGKGLLASVTSFISTGRDIARMPYCQDHDEQRKAILGVAIEALPLVLIDNVSGPFGSPVLDAAFTAVEWRDRLLGRSEMVTAPLATVWFVTANNVSVVGDTSRRCLQIRLDSPQEHPEERSDFKHPNLLKWVKAHRVRLTTAALTLLRAYCLAGRPDQKLTPWGSFEIWSALIRNCVVWLDRPDPGETRIELRSAAESEESLLREFVAGLKELCCKFQGDCVSAGKLVEELSENPSSYPRLRGALVELIPRHDKGDVPSPAQIGALLKRYRGRNLGGKMIEHAQGPRTNQGILWCVRSASGQADSDAGDASDAVSPFAEIASINSATRRETPSRSTPASLRYQIAPQPLDEKWEI